MHAFHALQDLYEKRVCNVFWKLSTSPMLEKIKQIAFGTILKGHINWNGFLVAMLDKLTGTSR